MFLRNGLPKCPLVGDLIEVPPQQFPNWNELRRDDDTDNKRSDDPSDDGSRLSKQCLCIAPDRTEPAGTKIPKLYKETVRICCCTYLLSNQLSITNVPTRSSQTQSWSLVFLLLGRCPTDHILELCSRLRILWSGLRPKLWSCLRSCLWSRLRSCLRSRFRWQTPPPSSWVYESSLWRSWHLVTSSLPHLLSKYLYYNCTTNRIGSLVILSYL